MSKQSIFHWNGGQIFNSGLSVSEATNEFWTSAVSIHRILVLIRQHILMKIHLTEMFQPDLVLIAVLVLKQNINSSRQWRFCSIML